MNHYTTRAEIKPQRNVRCLQGVRIGQKQDIPMLFYAYGCAQELRHGPHGPTWTPAWPDMDRDGKAGRVRSEARDRHAIQYSIGG